MSRPIRIGFISFAHMHAVGYAYCLKEIEGVEIAGVADGDRPRGKLWAGRLGTRYFPNTKDLLSTRPDAVVVTSENVRHTADVLAAAAAGAHVLCEKPIATNIRDAERQIKGCREAGVILETAFPVRFSPPVMRARRLFKEGAIGRLLAAKATNHGSMPGGWFTNPRLSGGGAVIDHTVHVVDLLRWFLEDEVVEVYAETGRLIYPRLKCEDCGLLSMKFKSGVFATLDTSWSRLPSFPIWGDVTMTLWGDKGRLSVDAFSQNVTVYGDRVRFEGWGSSPDMGLMQDFVETVRTGREPSISGTDGMRALEVALGAYRSARKGAPVRLPLSC